MKLGTVLVVLSVAAMALAGEKCHGDGQTVRQFNGRKEDMRIPCKYNAVHQRCGKYLINLTPGNIFLFPKYRLDSLWLGITDTEGGGKWEGRTDNKLSIKYVTGLDDVLFVKKGGNLKTKNVFTYGKTSKKTWVKSKDGAFRITFVPWDPENPKFPQSQWIFECKARSFEAAGYPEQVCGGDDRFETVNRMEQLQLKGREQAVMYDIFTNTDIVQMNAQCINATRLMTQVCTGRQRRDAIITCSQILSSYKHAKCVSKYSCDPMDTFVDCIDWVCSDYQDDFACERVAESIDMCRTFTGGNLTEKVTSKNCYKHFLSI